MGNSCTGKREKMDKASRYGKHLAITYKHTIQRKYTDIKEDAREKYEEAKFQYKLQKGPNDE